MTVFANGLEVSAKAQGNKIIAAFPDTCFTPPENPATPPGVPIPYPTFGFDSDTEKGTGTVKIGGKTVSQKNISYYSKTTGTEAGCAAKKGVITSTHRGKAYAASWSANVKAEGQPVARMSDLATVNHASPQPNDGNGAIVGGLGAGGGPVDCDALADQIEAFICRNKHEHKGRGVHGYLFRRAEQVCGEQGPGTAGYQTHQEELQNTYNALQSAVDAFIDGGCDIDEYDFSPTRRDGGRTDRIRDMVNRVRERDPDIQPGTVQHLGRRHPTCTNLDAARRDKTLAQIFNILGF
jgi:hypothetical protein